MFAVYDAVRVAEFESRSALPGAPVQAERASTLAVMSAKARLAVSGELHRLADALSPSGDAFTPRLSGKS
jgi:hypothetical protein